MKATAVGQNRQRRDLLSGTKRPGIWWLHPRTIFLCLGIPMLIGAYFIPENTYLTLFRTRKYVDYDFFIVGVIIYLGFIVGSFFAFGKGREGQGRDVTIYCRTFVWPFFALTVFGYIIWFASAAWLAGGLTPLVDAFLTLLFDPTLGTAPYLRDVLFEGIPGLSTLTQVGILYVTVEAWLWVRRAVNRQLAVVRLATVSTLALARALLVSERLALVEIAIPIVVVLLYNSYLQGSHRTLVQIAPVLLGSGVFALFAFAEYFRSWSYYKAIYPGDYLWFATQRFLGYYATSVNNAAIVYYFEPFQPLRYTLNDLFTFPLLGDAAETLYAKVFGGTYIEIIELIFAYGNIEFNTTAMVGLLANEYSVFFAPIIAFLLGALSSSLYESFLRGRLIGALLYPSWFVGLLEISRIYYWANQRYFPVLAFLVISLVLYRFAMAPPAPNAARKGAVQKVETMVERQ